MGGTDSAYSLARLAADAAARNGADSRLVVEGVTYRGDELAARTERIGAGLREIGVAPGARVVVLMANCAEVGLSYVGTWRAGAVATPVVFLVRADELRHILLDSAAVAVVTTPEWLGLVDAAVGDGIDTLRAVVVAGDVPEGTVVGSVPVTPFADVERAAPGGVTDRADDDLAALLYTGGTTGRAKGVALTHRGLWHAGQSAFTASRREGVNRTLVPLPLSHSYGLMVTVAGCHRPEAGYSVVQKWFDPVALPKLVTEHRLQQATLVPAMLAALLTQPLEDHDLSSLVQVQCGAAPLAPEIAREFERRVPSARVYEGYGLTETGGFAFVNPPDAPRPGTVGKAGPGYDVRVVDVTGSPVPPGEPGEVLIAGPGVMAGYWRDGAVDPSAVADGWVRTGDVGVLDEDGYLRIVDRVKDLVIRGGFNVYPRDVEDVLLAHPAVGQAAVVGRPDPRLGEEVVAFVALRPGAQATEEDLVEWCRQRLAATKYPREVRIVPAVPLTPIGKTDRKAVRALVAQEPAAG